MSDQIKVDFGTVASAGQSITSESHKIEGLIDNLRSQIANLQTDWEGSASAGFQQTRQKWESAAQDLNQTLAAIGAAVNQAHDNYQNTERTNQNRW